MNNNTDPTGNLSNQDIANMYPDIYNRVNPYIEDIATQLRNQNIDENMLESIVQDILRRSGLSGSSSGIGNMSGTGGTCTGGSCSAAAIFDDYDDYDDYGDYEAVDAADDNDAIEVQRGFGGRGFGGRGFGGRGFGGRGFGGRGFGGRGFGGRGRFPGRRFPNFRRRFPVFPVFPIYPIYPSYPGYPGCQYPGCQNEYPFSAEDIVRLLLLQQLFGY